MDHVINSLQNWLDIYKESEPNNKKAHECIKNAIVELQKYYPVTKDEFGNEIEDRTPRAPHCYVWRFSP